MRFPIFRTSSVDLKVNHHFNLYYYIVVLISDGSRRLSVAVDNRNQHLYHAARQAICFLTFEVKEHVGSIVLEHLSNKFDIHILDVDLLI